jgi:tetratricopeptide (TPR) repeat protein
MRWLAILLLAFSLQAQEAPAPAAPAPNVDEEFTKAVFFGKKFADMGDYASAFEHYSKADAVKPDQPAVLYNMGVVLARAGRYSEAQVKADRYLQLFPEGVEKADVQKLQLELEFQRELQKKRQADQEYQDLFNRAKFLYGRSELADALKLYRQAEQLRPNDPAAVFNQALVVEKQGDYAAAVERYRRYAELESDASAKTHVDEHVFELQRELEDMRTKIVCSFCGRKLPVGATWCERCWHGPYLVNQPVWNTRNCEGGASATRATYFSDGRFLRNDILPCLFKGSMLDALRYSPQRQREIRDARKAEGWTFANDALQSWSDKQGNTIKYEQGADYLEKITSSSGGEILTYVAHSGGAGIWLLDREDLIIDAQRYTSRFSFDSAGRITQQQVDYQNTAACNHLITETADFTYANDLLSSVAIKGSYEGYAAEGKPKADWTATVSYGYDEHSRLSKEELTVTSLNKTYEAKAQGAIRDELERLWPTMRVRRPIENAARSGDLCASAGANALSNAVDLRPFYTMSPNLGVALQNGITRMLVTFTYPAN